MFLEQLLKKKTNIKALRVLSMTGGAVSLEELRDEINRSIGATSEAIKDLKKFNLVKEIPGEGKRKYFKLNKTRLALHLQNLFAYERDILREALPIHIWNLIEEVVHDFRKILEENLKAVVLFGSYARGDYTPYSDIDLCLLVKEPIELDKVLETVDSYEKDFSIKVIELEKELTLENLEKAMTPEMRRDYLLVYGDLSKLKELTRKTSRDFITSK